MSTNVNKEQQAGKEHDSKAQTEVWEWKQKAFEALQDIPAEKRMAYIRNNTQPYIEAILAAKKNNKNVSNKSNPKL